MLGPCVSKVALTLLSSTLLVTLHAATATVRVPLPAGLLKGNGKLVLHITDLKLPPNSSGIVRVFANLPNANSETSTGDQHFLGYFTILAKNSVEAARGVHRKRATLDLSHKRQMLAGKREVTLTLVSLGGATENAGRNRPTFAGAYVALK